MLNKGIEATILPTKLIYTSNNSDGSVFNIFSCKIIESQGEIKVNPKYKTISVTGINLDEFQLQKEIKVELYENEKYEYSYSCKISRVELVNVPSEQWKYLKHCVTELQYDSFLNYFGEDVNIINEILSQDNTKKIIHNVYNVGDATLINIRKNINDKMSKHEIYRILDGYTFTENVISRIMNYYENNITTIKKILEENIYLFTEIPHVGFKTIDNAYLSNEKNSKEDKNRIKYGLIQVLKDQMNSGSTTCKRSKFINVAVDLLEVNNDLVSECLNEFLINGEEIINSYMDNLECIVSVDSYKKTKKKYGSAIVLYEDVYSLGSVFINEYFVYVNIVERTNRKPTLKEYDWHEIFEYFKNTDGIELSDEQKQFFLDMHDNNLQFLVANGGTGKSMSQKVLLEYSKRTNQSVELLAPTGKARKKLEEYTGQKASTIHSHLIQKNKNYANIVLVDESSMVDIDLVVNLFLATDLSTKMIFIGDDAQIPSVSYGNFLFDATKISKNVKVSTFSKVFRQSEGGILDIITKVRKGERFLQSTFSGRKVFGKDCVFNTKLEYGKDFADNAIETYMNLLKQGYEQNDIVLLTPSNKGINGTVAINRLIQDKINPKRNNQEFLSVVYNDVDIEFRINDLIMNLKNKTVKYVNLQKDLYDFDSMFKEGVIKEDGDEYIANGDVMTLKHIGYNYAYFLFDDKYVMINIADIKGGDMQHAWCMTGHKSQGSEYKIAICIVPKQAAFQMNGNLLYTMMSRAKEYLLVLGDMMTINRSLGKFENYRRETNLSIFFEKQKDGDL